MKPSMLMGAAILCATAVSAGCSSPPDRLAWDDNHPVLGPVSDGPFGSLVVVTPQGAGTGDDIEKHYPFYLYGADGKLLERFPNEAALPVRARPGKYIVAGGGLGAYRRVQVEVKENMTTVVRLTDLERGVRVE